MLLKRAAPTVEDIVPDLDLKIDAVFFFLAPYCYSLWHVSSEDAGTPATYPQCVSLVLYILGSLVLVVAAGELQYALSGTAYRGVSTWITYAFIVRTFHLVWLFLGSSAKVTLATMLFVVHLVGFIVLIPLFGLVGTSPGTLIAHVLGDEKAIKWWAPRDDKERYLIELARRKTVAP